MKNVRTKIYLDKGFLFSSTTHKLAVETSHWCQKSHPQSSLLIFIGASQGVLLLTSVPFAPRSLPSFTCSFRCSTDSKYGHEKSLKSTDNMHTIYNKYLAR